MSAPRTGFAYLDAALSGTPLAIAHRGGATHPDLTGLENTRHAFEHAAALGYRYLETDVHATSDGSLLAFHDDVLDRTTDGAGALSTKTADEVAGVRIGGEHAVPTMAELLGDLPDCRFNIDLKAPGAIAPLAALIDAHGAHDRVCVASFSLRRLAEFRRACGGRVATAAAPSEVAPFVAPGRLIHRALARRTRVLQVPWRHRHRPVTVVNPALVRRAHAAGVHVHVWTGAPDSQWDSIDSPATLGALIDLGVDGLIVDRTDLLREVLRERGLWRDPS